MLYMKVASGWFLNCHIGVICNICIVVDYLVFQGYPSAPSIHVIHKDPSGQGNLHTFASITCRNMEDNKVCLKRKKKRAHVRPCYLCFLGSQESPDVLLSQELQESLFDLGYQKFPSAHLHLKKTKVLFIRFLISQIQRRCNIILWHPVKHLK